MKSNPPTLFADTLSQHRQTMARRQKYIKQNFQAFGLKLAEDLNDWEHRSLYLRLAKNLPQELLEKAYYYVKDHSPGQIRSPAKLFMWKLKQLRLETDTKT